MPCAIWLLRVHWMIQGTFHLLPQLLLLALALPSTMIEMVRMFLLLVVVVLLLLKRMRVIVVAMVTGPGVLLPLRHLTWPL